MKYFSYSRTPLDQNLFGTPKLVHPQVSLQSCPLSKYISDEECLCYESFDIAGICAGKHFTEGGLLKFIDEAAKLARQGGMYETVNEVYKATLPVAEANRNFEKLAEVHKEISDAFQEIIRLQVSLHLKLGNIRSKLSANTKISRQQTFNAKLDLAIDLCFRASGSLVRISGWVSTATTSVTQMARSIFTRSAPSPDFRRSSTGLKSSTSKNSRKWDRSPKMTSLWSKVCAQVFNIFSSHDLILLAKGIN